MTLWLAAAKYFGVWRWRLAAAQKLRRRKNSSAA